MGSMHTGLEEAKGGFKRLAAYFGERARGQAGLIISGGIAPNRAGWVAPMSAKLTSRKETGQHKLITQAVHEEGGKICMQILHAGRYGYHPFAVSPSGIRSPISPFKPWKLSGKGVDGTINAFVNCAIRAREAGYDGVEIMGSEGYLINQFLVARTNQRTDKWGGSLENRMRFPIEIIEQTRKAVGMEFIIVYRLSMLDLVEDGNSWNDVEILAKQIEKVGASIINTGIGWHEARIPTIGTMVPRAGFSWVTKRLMGKVGIPLVTVNRINTPEIGEKILAEGHADMISMARPFLADPEFVLKAMQSRSDEINTCIACNQACLDHTFNRKISTCMVNPRACFETELNYQPVQEKKRIAVVGAGPSGLAASTVAALRGHEVHLLEANNIIGGQFNMAKQIPGKEEFSETLRYYRRQIELTGVHLHLNHKVQVSDIIGHSFDEVIICTGVYPRRAKIEGEDHPMVLNYVEVLMHHQKVGNSIAIIGAGGIGFDVAEYLSQNGESSSLSVKAFMREWGVDMSYTKPGGLMPENHKPANRQIYLLKRSRGKHGANLGKTTGWIHRTSLKKRHIKMISGVQYRKIDNEGLHITTNGEHRLLEVDNVVICAGQEPSRELHQGLLSRGFPVHIAGGAYAAQELDAKVAIKQGTELAAKL